MTTDIKKTTPKLVDAINELISSRLSDLNVALPAQIVSYDYDKNLAVIKPTIKRKYKGEAESVELPTISNVPVCFPRMGDGHLRFPVNKGDTGQAVFNQRSIDLWQVQGGIIDPEDPRRHSLSDAVFYPGLNPNNKKIKSSAAPDSVELKLKESYIEILGSGKFKITNGTEELFDLLVQTLDAMVTEMTEQGEVDTTNTIFGALPPNNFAAYTQLKTAYQNLKAKMESLKG